MTKELKYKEGQEVVFNGYTSKVDNEAFKKGDILIITKAFEDDNSYDVSLKSNDEVSDTAFEDEILDASEFVADETPETEAKEEPTKKVTKKPATKKATKKATAKKEVKTTEEEPKVEEKAVELTKEVAEEEAEVEKVEVPKSASKGLVSTAISDHGGDALLTAHTIVGSAEKLDYTLGGVLSHIKREELFTKISDSKGNRVYPDGIKGFNLYVSEDLGINERKADYLVGIYEKLHGLITEDQLEGLGWSKLKEVVRMGLDKDNVEEILDLARNKSIAELQEEVKTRKIESGEKLHGNTSTVELTSFKFSIFQDQGEMVKGALESCKEELGADTTDSQAFAHIAQHYLDTTS